MVNVQWYALGRIEAQTLAAWCSCRYMRPLRDRRYAFACWRSTIYAVWFTSNLWPSCRALWITGGTSPTPQVSNMKGRMIRGGSNQHKTPTREAALNSNGAIKWNNFLAMASDIQLVPYLMDVGVLKASFHQVSAIPHVTQREVGSSSNNKLNTTRPMSIRYPQFVEAISLLAFSTAGRLRLLYPDVAGQAPARHPSSTIEKSPGSPRERERMVNPERMVVHGQQSVTSGRHAGGQGSQIAWVPGQTVNALGGIAEMRRKKPTQAPNPSDPGTTDVGSRSNQSITSEASQPSYDLGALKAFFHHIRAAHEENRPRQHAGLNSTPAAGPRLQGGWGNSDSLSVNEQPLPERQTTEGVGKTSAERPESNLDMSEGRSNESVECPSDTDETEHSGPAQGGGKAGHRGEEMVRMRDSGQVFDQAMDWVSKLELKICRRNINERRDTRTGSYLQPVDLPGGVGCDRDRSVSTGLGHGGNFARLVVIKEIQPIPDHAPRDVVRLLELALDHQQAGRFASALGILEKAAMLWEQALYMGTNRPAPARQSSEEGQQNVGGRSRRLDVADQVKLYIMEAGIYQTAGKDVAALSTLLRASAPLGLIPACSLSLKDALMAAVLSEMGVVTYYLGRPALALHCFRLAFILRHNILEHEQRNPDNVEYPALRGLKGTHDLPFEARQDHSDSFVSIFAIAEAAAALTLNNVGTCLASVGEKGSAAESLTIASSVTTTALGIQHPRSAVVARNLALVRTAGSNNGSCSNERNRVKTGNSAIAGPRHVAIMKDEVELWASLGSRLWKNGKTEGGTPCASPSKRLQPGGMSTSRILSGGFFFSGKLPPGAEGASVRLVRKKKKGTKKKHGKSPTKTS